MFPGLYSHAGQFTAEGAFYYGSKWAARWSGHAACGGLRSRCPRSVKPRLTSLTWIPEWKEWITHSVIVSPDATRVYVSLEAHGGNPRRPTKPNGLVILDIREIKAGKLNPKMHPVGLQFWRDS